MSNDDKYIDLLLRRCVNVEKTKKLFISYNAENIRFVKEMVKKAISLGVIDIYLAESNSLELHEVLKNISLDEMMNHPYFDGSKWDEYAKKGASFVILETEQPGLMDDIDPKVLAKAEQVFRMRKPLYKKRQGHFEIPWVIAMLPSQRWAQKLFAGQENAYDLLLNQIYSSCMIDTLDPIVSWNDHLKQNQLMINALNHLSIQELIYKNSLGTDLKIQLTKEALWCDANMGICLPNLPSYEIFTTPNCFETEGIVYSSKPLVYGGGLVDNFYFKYRNGRIIDYGAEKGEEIIDMIIHSDETSMYLGEAALVNYDSPISNTNIVFGNTLYDENSRCHLAVGAGFSNCIKNGSQLSDDELKKLGINTSNIHVDFMIGTSDLSIVAKTYSGNYVEIFSDGNFDKRLLKRI